MKIPLISKILPPIFWIAFISLTSSCQASAIPTVEQPPSASVPGHVQEPASSGQRILPGQQLRFETISLEEGLSQSTVFSILQDSQGFMWFGTEDGLNRYDGYDFAIYKHDPGDPSSLSSSWIQVIFEDRSGGLWIGTSDQGLNLYDRKTDTFTQFRNDPEDPFSLGDNMITSIYQDRQGFLWVGTAGGLDMVVQGGDGSPDNQDRRFIHHQHDPDDPNSLSADAVTVIHGSRDSSLWIGTDDGVLNRLVLSESEGLVLSDGGEPDGKNGSWTHYGVDDDVHNLGHHSITAIFEDNSGILWIGSRGGGLDSFDHENDIVTHYQHDPNNNKSLSSDNIQVIYQDVDGMLWIGTFGGGINRFDSETGTFAHYKNDPGDPSSLGQDTILSILQDREGILWFGTIGSGISKLDIGWRNFVLYQNNPEEPNSLGDNMVRTFFPDSGGTLWIGTMFGGLDRFDRQSDTWRHYRHDPIDPNSLSSDFVSIIYRDHSGILWIGTTRGLDRFNPETETFSHYDPDPYAPAGSPRNNVRAIHEYQSDMYWVGTKSGLFRFDFENNSWSQPDNFRCEDSHDLGTAWVLSILEDSDGVLWITTAGEGLFSLDLETETISHYHNDPDDASSLSNNYMISGVEDRGGTLWFSTLEGINKYDPAVESFTKYRGKDGLPNETIYCILEDLQGNLWASTNNGISEFDPQGKTFQNYDVTDGLQSNEFNGNACYFSDDGEIFFGGIEGFNTFFPGQIQKNPVVPPVVLTRLSYGDEPVNMGQINPTESGITMKWPDNAFEFEFAALSFAQPEVNTYAYYLEGFEDTWNNVGTRRYGSYTNLPGGTYTLRVKGSNNDGVWNEIGTAVEVTVIPPIWQTWWLRGSAALLLVGASFLGYRLRVRNIERRSRNLEILVEERTAELQRETAQRTQAEEALRNSEMEKAVANERSRLARELHDSVTQSLYSLTLFTEAARTLAEEGGNETIEQYVGQIGVIGLQALKEMRLLVFELQPPELEKEGLVSALRRRLEAVEGRAGVDARVVVDEIIKLPGNVEQEFYRIAQEALNNSLKHAGAASVILHLQRVNKGIEMAIVDDGVGFEPESLPDSGGMGLKNIRERAERLGSSVSITSSPGGGTRISVWVEDIFEPQHHGGTNE